MNIFYVVNARMPTEKAHGIQIAKMCEAFISQGAKVKLVVPNRKTVSLSVREFYNLKMDVEMIRLPIVDVYRFGSFGFIIGSVSFMIVSFLFIVWQRIKKEKLIVYTVDMDTFSSSLLPLTGFPVFTEMHNGKPYYFAQKFLFRFLSGIITINQILASDFKKKFRYSRTKYLIEPNGVDVEFFQPRDKFEARKHLNLSRKDKIVLYVGRFFDWKGLEIIPVTARINNDLKWYLVGGTFEDFVHITGIKPESSMIFVGSILQSEVIWWIAAADVLLVLGTKRDRQSYYYTSPMKLFEYLLSSRIIVASGTPAISEIVSDKEVLFYNPDSAEDLSKKVRKAINFSTDIQDRVDRAIKLGLKHSWNGRAGRIIKFIKEQSYVG